MKQSNKLKVNKRFVKVRLIRHMLLSVQFSTSFQTGRTFNSLFANDNGTCRLKACFVQNYGLIKRNFKPICKVATRYYLIRRNCQSTWLSVRKEELGYH